MGTKGADTLCFLKVMWNFGRTRLNVTGAGPEGTDSVALHGVACDTSVGMSVETERTGDDTERD